MQITGNTEKALTLCSISLHLYLYQKTRCLEEIKTTPKHKNLVGFYTRKMSIWNHQITLKIFYVRFKGSTFFLKTKHKILKDLFLWKKLGHFRWFTELNSPQYSQHLLQIEIARIGNIAEGMGENSNETKSFHLDFIKQSFSHNLLYHFKA